jgi:hypothetical protein
MVKTQKPVNEPCPFCGDRRAQIDTLKSASGKRDKFRAQCQDYFAATHWCDTEQEAWEAWEKRDNHSLENIFICKDLFVFKGCIHARNPETQYCYIDGLKGYKRMKKGEYLKAYAECAKAAGKVKK